MMDGQKKIKENFKINQKCPAVLEGECCLPRKKPSSSSIQLPSSNLT